jgi:nucleotide-binding universal stress UspA family protein
MKKIISIIFSFEDVERIADYAIKLARDLNRELEFFHAAESKNISWDPTVTKYNSLSNVSQGKESLLVKERERVLQKVLHVKKVSLDYDYPVSYTVVPGSLSEVVKMLAERDDVEMVLVPHSSKNKMDVVVAELIDYLDLPVFTFRPDMEYHKIKTIVYASDYRKQDVKVLKRIAQLAKKLMASVTVFHALKSDEFEEELKKNGLQELVNKKIDLNDISVEREKAQSSAKGIRRFTQKSYADLVVLLKSNKNFLQKIFGKSTTKEILHDIDTPVLIYHQ